MKTSALVFVFSALLLAPIFASETAECPLTGAAKAPAANVAGLQPEAASAPTRTPPAFSPATPRPPVATSPVPRPSSPRPTRRALPAHLFM